MITQQTRQLSFNDIQEKKKIRYVQILDRLKNREMTAKEIAVELFDLGLIPSTERNYTAPRLTELAKMGFVKVVGKKKCEWTGKQVAVYKVNKINYGNGNIIKIRKIEADNINHYPVID